MSNMMIGGTDDFNSNILEFGIDLHGFIIGGVNFETNMIEVGFLPEADRQAVDVLVGDGIDFEEEFVMGAARRKESGPWHVNRDFMET